MSEANLNTVRDYFAAVARGDIAALDGLFADTLVWHQPGQGSLSGTRRGKADVFALLGAFFERSQGTFRISEVGTLMANGDFVATTLRFEAAANGKAIAMAGVDVLRIENGKIAEVWLFSEDQPAEDAFWG